MTTISSPSRSIGISIGHAQTIDTQLTDAQIDTELHDIRSKLGLPGIRDDDGDRETYASYLHDQVDALIRKRAREIIDLMNTHDRIAKLVP